MDVLATAVDTCESSHDLPAPRTATGGRPAATRGAGPACCGGVDDVDEIARSDGRLVTQAPPGCVTRQAFVASAWEDVADLSASFGIQLDEWQEVVLQAGMGERADGTWATPQVAVSAPRRDGKSQIIVARALAGVLVFGERTIIVSTPAGHRA